MSPLIAGVGIGAGLFALLVLIFLAWAITRTDEKKEIALKHMAETERCMQERNGLDIRKIAVLREIADTLRAMHEKPE